MAVNFATNISNPLKNFIKELIFLWNEQTIKLKY